MSKKTKALKHANRLRSHKKRRPNPAHNKFALPAKFPLPPTDATVEMFFDQALMVALRVTGIRDALLKAVKTAAPKDEETTGTIQ